MLPFQTKPKEPEIETIETPEGKLYLLRRGFITVSEQVEIEESLLQNSRSLLAALKLVSRICQERGLSRDEAAAVLDNPSSHLAIASEYETEFAEILNSQADLGSSGRLKEVTVFIRHRAIDPDRIKSGKILSGTFIGCSDWSEGDTELLDQATYRAIGEFIDRERSGGKKPTKTPTTSRGGSSPSKPTSTPEPSTGGISTGDSAPGS
jgi:hypothetical protein